MHGGARPGAGRKSGVSDKNKVAKQVIAGHAEAVADLVPEDVANLTPLQVMLRAMTMKASEGDWDAAAEHAAKVAPYLHPKLAPRPAEDPTTERKIVIVGGLPDTGETNNPTRVNDDTAH